MSYTPIQAGPMRLSQKTSVISRAGENMRSLQQMLDTQYAISCVNYMIDENGQLKKRKGKTTIQELAEVASMIEAYTDDIWFFAYDRSLIAWDRTLNTLTTIKSNFRASERYQGLRYGDYFFIINGKEVLFRISRTLNYDAQTAEFTVGTVVRGATSGATGVILQDEATGGATGTLTLGNISGTFVDNEVLEDNNSIPGVAVANGVVTFTATGVGAAPIAGVIALIETRLFLGNLRDDRAAVAYSAVDSGANPPFTDWTVSTSQTGAGRVNYRNAGAIQAIQPLGQNIVVLAERGKFAFFINQLDSGGSIKKTDVFVQTRLDFGAAPNAIATDKGLFYANRAGLWQLVSVGQDNIPFSDQEFLASILLGPEFFADLNLDDADIIYDSVNNIVMLTCAKDSQLNNLVIVYNTETKAMTQFQGWNIKRWLSLNQEIYALSSIDGRVFKCFEGFDDDGLPIGTEYSQEINLSPMYFRSVLQEFYCQGLLSEDSAIAINFSIYDPQGCYEQNKKQYTWNASDCGSSPFGGWGAAAFGVKSWGGASLDPDFASTVPSFNGIRPWIRNFQRVIVSFTSGDKLPHTINWFSIGAKTKVPIRIRNLNPVTS